MKRSGPPQRKTRLKSKGGSRFPKRRCPEYMDWLRQQPCIVAMLSSVGGCGGAVEAAHVRSRGAGGDDLNNTVPLCRQHHGDQHAIGIQTFQATYEIDMPESAREHTARWEQEREAA